MRKNNLQKHLVEFVSDKKHYFNRDEQNAAKIRKLTS